MTSIRRDVHKEGAEQVLLSRSHDLIFIKTKKTAGTTVEAYLEVACDPARWTGDWENLHVTDGVMTDDLIVTARGDGTRRRGSREHVEVGGVRLTNHMPPSSVIAAFGRDIWNASLTCAGVRNPWDRMASMFFWTKRRDSSRDHLLADPEAARAAFAEFIEGWQRESIDDEIMSADVGVDAFIRYEHLTEDLGRLLDRCSLGDPGFGLPRLKAGSRPEGYAWLYSEDSKERVATLYADQIDRFGYLFG